MACLWKQTLTCASIVVPLMLDGHTETFIENWTLSHVSCCDSISLFFYAQFPLRLWFFFFKFSHNFSSRFVLKFTFFFRCQFQKISISETRKKHFCISNTFLRFRMSCFTKKIQVFWSKHSVYCSCYYMFYLLHTHTIIFKFDGNKITLQKNCSRFLWFLY